MNVTLRRVLSTDLATFGVLQGDDFPFCLTLELPWLDNQVDKSCVPAGTYHCIPHNTPKHPNTWELTGVPGRSDILIHTGNSPDDSEGCILVGSTFSGDQTFVESSIAAMALLHRELPPEFDLTIIDP